MDKNILLQIAETTKEIEDLKAKIAFLEFQLSALMKEVGDSKTVRYSTSIHEL